VKEARDRILASHPKAQLELLALDLATPQAVIDTTHRFPEWTSW